jgi:non-homologous end joining protein Ku
MAYPAFPETTESELMARQLIQMLAADWDPSLYKDSYREAVMNLIATKRTGGEVVPHSPAITANSNVVDFADAVPRGNQG